MDNISHGITMEQLNSLDNSEAFVQCPCARLFAKLVDLWNSQIW